MVELNLSGVVKQEHITHTEYNFENADDFYNVLLNFSDNMDTDLQSYHPAVQGQVRWMFRGHWDSDWELIPGIFRKNWYKKFMLKPHKGVSNSVITKRPQVIYIKNVDFIKISKKQKIKFQILMEYYLLERFMDTANSLGIECNYTPYLYEYYERIQEYFESGLAAMLPKWPDTNIWPLIASAQHHGLPTRFLDFTYNPFFAAFFAASYPFFEEYITKGKKHKKNKDLCIWAIDKKTATNIISTTHKKPLQEIPVTNNRLSNLFAQEGVLVLDPDANQKFMYNNGEWQGLETMGKPDSFIKFTLPQSKYKDLLRRLWENDITPARITPNLDRVTETLEYVHWLWTEK